MLNVVARQFCQQKCKLNVNVATETIMKVSPSTTYCSYLGTQTKLQYDFPTTNFCMQAITTYNLLSTTNFYFALSGSSDIKL